MQMKQLVVKLKEYFEGECPGMTVQTDPDIDHQAWIFRFCEGSEFRQFRVSVKAINDSQSLEIIKAKLEKHKWKLALETADSRPIIFTSRGSEYLG